MKVCGQQLNVYLALITVLPLLCGCETEKNKKANTAALRVHIEVQPDNATGSTQTISVLRSDPVVVTIARESILTEANIVAAKVIDAPGGPAIEIQFDENSSWVLEQYSATNPGKHFVIFGQWGDKLSDGRWLAAPLITHRLANGMLSFTPDASREEAEQLVLGLNKIARKTAHTHLMNLQK
jgi:preprotein translocase subunit SecD